MVTHAPLGEVRLLAAGSLPDRPNPRPLLFSCDTPETSETPGAERVDPCRPARLEAWQRLQATRGQSAALTYMFQGDGPAGALHAQRLRQDWQRLCAEADIPLLVYLHCGHQPDTRSPILQHLLQTLDHHGPVHALRVECRKSLSDAMVLARALTARSRLSLVLRDPTQRLSPRPAQSRPLRYALLGTRDRAEALSPRLASTSGSRVNTRSGSLSDPIPDPMPDPMSGTFAATPFRSL